MVLGFSQKERNAALWTALQSGEEEAIRQALARGGDPNMTVPEEGGVSVLAWSANRYYDREVRERCLLLLDAGADPNLADAESGKTPLHIVVRRGHGDVASKMLEKGGDPLKKDKHGDTPLSLAVSSRSWSVYQALLTPEVLARLPVPVAGDRDSLQAVSLLRVVIEQGGYGQHIKPLLDKIPDISAGLEEGYALAHSAIARGNTAALEALMARADFDINMVVPRNGRTLLHVAIGHENAELAQSLIAKGADVAAADARGRTPLEAAAQNGFVHVIHQIMKKLHEKTGEEKPVPEVLNRAVLAAAGNGHARAVEVLIRYGADKEAVNDKGETPLILAARGGHLEAVKMLVVKCKVETQTPDASGMIAYDHAVEMKRKGKADMADYLVLFQPGYEPPPPPPPPPLPVDHGRYTKVSDYSIDVKEKGLTMTFNFWTQQVVYREPDVRQGNMTVLRFDDIQRQEAIMEAREMLERLGGRPPVYDSVGAQKASRKGLGGLNKS